MLMDLIHDVSHEEEPIFAAIRANGLPVVLFGAGDMCCHVLNYLRSNGIEPNCICDNDRFKHGTYVMGLKVVSYSSLKETLNRYQIVVSVGIQYKEIIMEQLYSESENNPIWYLRGYEICGEKTTYHYIKEHSDQFNDAYTSLIDDFSKKVFVNVLNAKISGDFSLYHEIVSKSEYYDETILELRRDEVLLDVGAFKGQGIFEFAKRTTGIFDGIIALEPDRENLTILKDNLDRYGIKVEVHAVGAWHEHGFLFFHEGHESSSRLADVTEEGGASRFIEVDMIDRILHGRRVTYITMDIEGAEHKAILGALQTIKRWRPTIAVCAYHRREDLFDLLLLLKSMGLGYKFYLRHYTDNQTETVLYAVPE